MNNDRFINGAPTRFFQNTQPIQNIQTSASGINQVSQLQTSLDALTVTVATLQEALVSQSSQITELQKTVSTLTG